jgi:hypothetical protein
VPADGSEDSARGHLRGISPSTKRERGFIHALSLIFNDPAVPYSTRALNDEVAMRDLAAANPTDVEASERSGRDRLCRLDPQLPNALV